MKLQQKNFKSEASLGYQGNPRYIKLNIVGYREDKRGARGMDQWVKVIVPRADNLSSSVGTCRIDGENRLLLVSDIHMVPGH